MKRTLVVVLVGLGACGGGSGSDVDAPATPDAPPAGCTMTLTGDVTASGPCGVRVEPHGVNSVDAARFRVELTSAPTATFELEDFSVSHLDAPRSPLTEQAAADGVQFEGVVEDGRGQWTVSGGGGTTTAGSFTLTLAAGRLTPEETFPDPHGVLDATLVGGGGSVMLHAEF